MRVSSPVKCESQWAYSAQHTHPEHTHTIHVGHTHTEHNTHITHTQKLFHGSRVSRGPWSLWAAITKDTVKEAYKQ